MTSNSKSIRLGISPCPNDTFMFHGIATGRLTVEGYSIELELHDVETLNQMALDSRLDVSKLSAFAWLQVQERYQILNCGAALGYGCGPILIAKKPVDPSDLPNCRVALPGAWTTAHLLFRMWAPQVQNRYFVTYDRVFSEIDSGRADCGVIIHENRFTYEREGYQAVVDLGAWWETETGLPIPLGCIAARRDLGQENIGRMENLILQSIREAQADPQATLPYVRDYAQEMEEAVLWQHVQTFVNDFSLDLGARGRAALAALDNRARSAGVLP